MDKKIEIKLLLLGATGFVGRNVSKSLDRQKIAFIPASISLGFDLRNPETALRLIKRYNPDIIINCAAHVGSLNYVTRQAADVIADNAEMIMSMYKAVARVNTKCVIINPIANCTYPAVDEKFSEDDLWKGQVHSSVLAYGGAKRFLLIVAKSFEMQYGIKSIQLLVPNMYGPFDSSDPNKAHALNALISRFVKAELSGSSEITLWGTGIAIREWLYAEDFGRILISVIRNINMIGLAEPLNIAQNFGLSVKELVSIIRSHFSSHIEIKWDSSMPDGAPKKVMDDTKFRKVFRDFEFTNFEKGIPETIKYYRIIYPY